MKVKICSGIHPTKRKSQLERAYETQLTWEDWKKRMKTGFERCIFKCKNLVQHLQTSITRVGGKSFLTTIQTRVNLAFLKGISPLTFSSRNCYTYWMRNSLSIYRMFGFPSLMKLSTDFFVITQRSNTADVWTKIGLKLATVKRLKGWRFERWPFVRAKD